MKKKDALLKKLSQSLDQRPAAPSNPANPASPTAARAHVSTPAAQPNPANAPDASRKSSAAATATAKTPATSAAPSAHPAGSASSTTANVSSLPPRRAAADQIVSRAVPWTMGAGLIPIPLADAALVIALQLKLLRELSALYDRPFAENRAKSVVAALVGGVLPVAVASSSTAMFLKLLPGVGTLVGAATFSVIAGATTLAIGKVFIAHFETGGSLLDADVAQLQESFAYRYAEAREHCLQFAQTLKP